MVCALFLGTSCSSDDETMVSPSALPDNAKTFLDTHFPNVKILAVEKENSARTNGSVYDVSLVNGFEIDFDIYGHWTEIDGNTSPVPALLIPEKIQQYVTANYSGAFIVQIENEKVKYDVELSNNLDLVFTPEGNFVRIDYDGDNHNEIVVNPATLPDIAKTFLSTHFPSVTIVLVEKQYTARPNGSFYDVTLANGFEIDFDIAGNWTEIDGNYTAIPIAIIPEKILSYVTSHYPTTNIVQIDKETTHYEVELSNDLDLVFTSTGDFIRID
ncbi:PepSY-like domain-containing protein [Flavobacterium sp. LAR06]|uniref:PepSY-like domain-containing protein n=1 Tax=Flavobacterium sp. LAR06 TaxID=3064897 RepID=UPI0035C03FED